MYGTSRPIRGSAVVARINLDVSDEAPDAGQTVDVFCQAADGSGNGVPQSGVSITLSVTGPATLADTTLISDAWGKALTSCTVDEDAALGSKVTLEVADWSA